MAKRLEVAERIRARLRARGIDLPASATHAEILAVLKETGDKIGANRESVRQLAARPTSPRSESLLRVRDVMNRTRLSRSTIYRLERAGDFPRRRELSKNIVAYGESEVLAWIANRKRRGSGVEN